MAKKQKRGFAVTIHSLRNFKAEGRFKVSFGIMAGSHLIEDITGTECMYTVSTHDPKGALNDGRPGTSNKAIGDEIV